MQSTAIGKQNALIRRKMDDFIINHGQYFHERISFSLHLNSTYIYLWWISEECALTHTLVYVILLETIERVHYTFIFGN